MPPAEAVKAKAAIKRTSKVKPVEQVSPSQTGTVRTIESTRPEVPKEVFVDRARGAKAESLAKILHEHEISFADAQRMDAANWADAAKAAKVNAPSPASIKQALFELQKLERKSAIVNKNPKAAAIAEELAREMTR